jgi:hypothetical protein
MFNGLDDSSPSSQNDIHVFLKQGIKNDVYIATPMLRVDISLSLPYSLVKRRFKRLTVTDT